MKTVVKAERFDRSLKMINASEGGTYVLKCSQTLNSQVFFFFFLSKIVIDIKDDYYPEVKGVGWTPSR